MLLLGWISLISALRFSVSILDRANRVLISGDIGCGDYLLDDLQDSDFHTYRRSTESLKSLDVYDVRPGHG